VADNHDELLSSVSFFRNRKFAEWFVATLVLAVECEPELVRNALAKAFDLKRVEAQHDEFVRRSLLARQDLDALKSEIAELRETVRKANEYLNRPANGKPSGRP
jgi:hypothetical protein